MADRSKVVVATFNTLETGRNACQSLLLQGFERGYIGLAARKGAEDGSLVSVTVTDDDVKKAEEALNRHGPQSMQTHEVQWRGKGWPEEIPNADAYTAVDLVE